MAPTGIMWHASYTAWPKVPDSDAAGPASGRSPPGGGVTAGPGCRTGRPGPARARFRTRAACSAGQRALLPGAGGPPGPGLHPRLNGQEKTATQHLSSKTRSEANACKWRGHQILCKSPGTATTCDCKLKPKHPYSENPPARLCQPPGTVGHRPANKESSNIRSGAHLHRIERSKTVVMINFIVRIWWCLANHCGSNNCK